MYRLATMPSFTDRRTGDIMMPIVIRSAKKCSDVNVSIFHRMNTRNTAVFLN